MTERLAVVEVVRAQLYGARCKEGIAIYKASYRGLVQAICSRHGGPERKIYERNPQSGT